VPGIPTGVAGTDNPYGPLITFQTEGIPPPGAVYVGPTESLLIFMWSASVVSTALVVFRLLTPQGEIKFEQYQISGQSAGGIPIQLLIPPSEGFLLSCVVSGTNTQRGQCYVKLLTAIGSPTSLQVTQLLAQGYVSTFDSMSYPESPTESSISGRGWLNGVFTAAPAAGTDIGITVPAFRRWRLIGFAASLNTSAAAGMRQPTFSIADPAGTGDAMNFPTPTVGPSFSGTVTWGAGAGQIATPNVLQGSLPVDVLVSGGWAIGTSTFGLQAGDQWGASTLFVEEWQAP